MGAVYSSVRIQADTQEELRNKFSELQDFLRYERGADYYAGHLGIKRGLTISENKFNNTDEAGDYLCEESDKSDPAVAVQVTEEGKTFWLVGGLCRE